MLVFDTRFVGDTNANANAIGDARTVKARRMLGISLNGTDAAVGDRRMPMVILENFVYSRSS